MLCLSLGPIYSLNHSFTAFFLQMPLSIGCWKAQAITMKFHKMQQQHIYRPCQLGHVGFGHTLITSVCLLMLPVLWLTAEHAQLATTYHMNAINQWHVHGHCVTFSCTSMLLLSLSNVLPAMILQNSAVRLNIDHPLLTSSHFNSYGIPNVFDCMRLVVGVLARLLLLSGDIETNPGPIGEFSVLYTMS